MSFATIQNHGKDSEVFLKFGGTLLKGQAFEKLEFAKED